MQEQGTRDVSRCSAAAHEEASGTVGNAAVCDGAWVELLDECVAAVSNSDVGRRRRRRSAMTSAESSVWVIKERKI